MSLFAAVCAVFGAAGPEPVTIPPGVTPLMDVGLYRVGALYTDGRSVEMPTGWVGHFHGPTGISYTPYGQQNGKANLLIHCPWRQGTGVTYVEYALRLPEVRPITLELAIAMKSDVAVPEKSDGCDFRVSVSPAGGSKRVLLDEHYRLAEWKPLSFDLSGYAGQCVVVRLESGPGPKGDASWDYSLFGDARIVAGAAGAAMAPESIWPAKADLKRLCNRRDWGCCPTGAAVKLTDFKWDESTGVARYELSWPDEGGGVIYAVRTRCEGEQAASGLIDIRATVKTPKGGPSATYHIGLGSGVVLSDGKTSWESGSPGVEVRSVKPVGPVDVSDPARPFRIEDEYVAGAVRTRVIREFRLRGSSLVVTISTTGGGVSEVRHGGVAAGLRRSISLPYLGLGPIWYLPDTQVFGSIVLDWTDSKASRHDQTAAHYSPKTDGTRNAVATTAYYTLAPRVGDVLCNLPSPPSPFLEDLAGRIMFDVWGGKFREDADWFGELEVQGVRDAAIIKHVWQRSGYDNALPNHVPANKDQGGDEDMTYYVRTTRALGHRTSLHENYVDFYPNSELYDANDVSLESDGTLVKAWFNGGTGIQSYGAKPTGMLKYARMESPEIHRRYGTNASYLDVHTCVPPWFHVDHRAGEPGAATFEAVWKANSELFAFERKTHEGPLFGEGNNHFYWAGLCDGCEAQVAGGEDADWVVDFDLLKIHPQMVNHGMGYLERWLSSGYDGGWYSRVPTTRMLDKYRAMELAFGHAGFVAQQVWRQMPYVIREYYLVTPIQDRYVTARPAAILYDVGGKMLPATEALKAGPMSNRVHVEYDGGLKLWCNGGEKDWALPGGQVLCEYGFRAEAPGLVATTTVFPTLNGGKVVADYREADEVLFADARSYEPDLGVSIVDVEPSIAGFERVGPRKFTLAYKWQARAASSQDWTCYVHFCSPKVPGEDHIAFQNDHALSRAVSTWKAGETIGDGPHEIVLPAGVGDGEYDVMIGLYNASGRAALPFETDVRARCKIGTVTVKGDEVACAVHSLVPRRPAGEAGPYNGHRNVGKAVVDFGKVATNGCIAMAPKYGSWSITVYPRATPWRIRVKMDQIDPEMCKRAGKWSVHALNNNKRDYGPIEALKADGDLLEWEAGGERVTFYCIMK
ncbi:MAG: hypothetical protein JXQ73_19390 [Phycisphaerae bacterium]|nr:hypothetical protein [Phycisphaerae bacterium]